MLVLTVGCNVLSGNTVWAGVSIACVLMVCIYALGGISGANFNPAVSVALGLNKTLGGNGMPWRDVVIYCLVQSVAGAAAAFSYSLLFFDNFTLGPAKGFDVRSLVLCELLYTFMLCFVVLNVAAAKKFEDTGNQYFGLAIGFVIVAGAYGAGAISGGCFNPAVAFGIDISSVTQGFGYCLVYILAELLGSALAVACFRIVRPEDFNVEPRLSHRLAAEFIGTFMLVLTVGLNVLAKSPAGAFSIAASLMCMIYAVGDVSGANFNPAVTFAIVLTGKTLSLTTGALYMTAQWVAGVCAACTYTYIYHGKTFELGPVGPNTWGRVAFAETMFTFVLCFVVLSVAIAKTTASKDMFGLTIGSCITVGGFAIGGISGASLNPAVSVGIASIHLINKGWISHAFIYTAFEMVGATLAVGALMVTHKSEFGKQVDDDGLSDA